VPTPQVERQSVIQGILQQLHGVEPLKKLFWTELNYDRVNRPLSRTGWDESTAGALSSDPVLLASGGDQFHVIHACLNSEKLLITKERPVVARLLRDHPYALFVFSNRNEDHWHFVNVKYDDDAQRRRLYRRITIGPEERLRTASERLDKINLADAGDHAPNAIQKLHDDAFDVEPVTKEFFKEYGRIFDEVEESVRGLRDKDRKHLFVQRLFNRIMFIAFIQKKGWLKLHGDIDYLNALWRAYQRDAGRDENFYRDRLQPLFFRGLNSENQAGNRNGVSRIIGQVPYLNGGLFEEDEDDKDEDIVVPDKGLDAVLNDLFARFNFTVTESTPLDVEVAVDPEMLGKIFEEMVTGRHETGSYYTPKPIVSFMCREALKGYLESQLPTEAKDAVADFVDEHNPSKLRNAEAALEALRRIKVCDPACGSGAYLVGMLHELLDLRACLFVTRNLDARSIYARKLEIIQKNVYGVDIDAFAVNIARLRLWLSLSVDYDGDVPPPLPNLDYKVEAGDSIGSPNPSGFQLGLRKGLVDEFLAAKAEYISAHHSRKSELRKKIDQLRQDIATWAHRNGNVSAFDWPIEFAEVFIDGGFDVVIANPPYLRMELFKEIKPILKRNFADVHADRADLYCYFYARSTEMLRRSGMLAFISSDKWLRARYGENLRKYLITTCGVQTIIDFGDLPVFESATSYPMILVAQKGGTRGAVRFTQVESLDPPYPDVARIIAEFGITLQPSALNGGEWRLESRSSEAGTPLVQYVGGQIFYGVKTGLNEAFFIDKNKRRELIAEDPRCSAFIKPLISGRDIHRWKLTPNDKWLLYLKHGVNAAEIKPILKHLRPFKERLEQRATHQEWYELQQPQYRYTSEFAKPKIVYQVFQVRPCFAYDPKGCFVVNSVYVIPSNDLFLLGVLNSEAFWQEVCRNCSPIQNGYQLMLSYFGKCLIPTASNEERKKIATLVEEIVSSDKFPTQNEMEIESRVATLYGRRSSPQAHGSVAPIPHADA